MGGSPDGGADGARGTPSDSGAAHPYASWFPAPAELGIGTEHYAFATLDAERFVALRDRLADAEYEAVADRFGSEGSVLPPIRTVRRVTALAVGTTTLLGVEGSFSADEATARLTAAGYEPTGDHGGYALYDGQGFFGVREGILAGSRSGSDGTGATVRTLLDARRGEADRLVAADEDADRLVGALGTGLNAVGTVTPSGVAEGYDPANLDAIGRGVHVEGDVARFDLALVYATASAAAPETAVATARDRDDAMSRARDVSVASAGRVVTVSGRIDVDRLTVDGYTVGIGPDPDRTPPSPPRANFEFDYDRPADTLRITHAGGESFTRENTAGLLYGPPESEELAEWPLPVGPGDSRTVRAVASGDAVVVYWQSFAGDRIPVAHYAAP